MSGKVQKQLRKQAREELEKIMQSTQQPKRQQDLGLKVISALEDFIQLCTVLTGEKPNAITLTEAMYNSYIQESQRHAEVLGLNPGFKTEEPTFLGVKLVKKSPLIVPPTPTLPVEPKTN